MVISYHNVEHWREITRLVMGCSGLQAWRLMATFQTSSGESPVWQVSSSISWTHVWQGVWRWHFHSGLLSAWWPVRVSTARDRMSWSPSGWRCIWPKAASLHLWIWVEYCRAVGYVLPTLPTSLYSEPGLSSGRERSVSLDLSFGTLFLSLFEQ